MDAGPDPSPLAPASFGSLLNQLDLAISRPLEGLRDRLAPLRSSAPKAPAGAPDHVATIAALCDEMLGLTHGFLDVLALDHGARPARPGSLKLAHFVSALHDQYAPLAASRGLGWSCRLDGPAGATVRADAELARRLVGHLIDNALAYTPPGGRVEVAVRGEESGWSVAVTDDGSGIPAESLARLFEPFARLPRDERAGRPGLGLGLASARAIARLLGGTVELSPAGPAGGILAVVRLPQDGASLPR